MEKRFEKRDLILLLVILLVVTAVWNGYKIKKHTIGNEIRVTIEKEEYGIYSLNQDQEIPIQREGVFENLLIIKDGQADMIGADCPDQLCVDMKPISAEGETIVCLPHKLVVEVISSEEKAELDTIAK